MTQLALFAAPAVEVIVACPACDYVWHTATIHPGAWWAEGLTPAKCAAQIYCPACGQKPPMRVQKSDENTAESLEKRRECA